MKSITLAGLAAATLFQASLAAETRPQAATAAPTPEAPAASVAPEAPRATRHGFGHTLLLYIPNRVLDVFDIVRLRVRLGPGIAVGFRVTKLTDVFLGSYASVYLGLPGPRQEPQLPRLAGFESRSGLAASVADATVTSYSSDPYYAVTEVGAGAQAVLAGAEAGVDPAEVFDLVLGVLTIDFRGDDL